MALLNYADIEQHDNTTLTAEGQAAVEQLIAGVEAWAAGYLGYPIEQGSTTEIHDGGSDTLVLRSMAPVSGALTITEYNDTSEDWDAYTGTARVGRANIARLSESTPYGFDNVTVTYTTGWTRATLPADLKNALVSLVSTKFRATESPSGQLKSVTVGPVTETYATATETSSAEVPADVLEVVSRYRTPVV